MQAGPGPGNRITGREYTMKFTIGQRVQFTDTSDPQRPETILWHTIIYVVREYRGGGWWGIEAVSIDGTPCDGCFDVVRASEIEPITDEATQ